MKQTVSLLLIFLAFGLGCARVRVEAPKEPIKVDISMRLDIYQHVQKDIDAIEDIVTGSPGSAKPSEKQSLLGLFITNAYAQDLSPEVEAAALRRKARLSELSSWMEKGVIGENRVALLEIRKKGAASAELEELIRSENKDRMVIYAALADKNQISVGEMQKIYAEKLQGKAPTGTPIEVFNTSSGTYEWRIK